MGTEFGLTQAKSWDRNRDRKGGTCGSGSKLEIPQVPHRLFHLTKPDQAERQGVKAPLTSNNWGGGAPGDAEEVPVQR